MINLKDLITKYPQCIENSNILSAYLNILYPEKENKRQAEIIIAASESGFPTEVLKTSRIKTSYYNQYVENLAATTDLSHEEATIGIEYWANALSVEIENDSVEVNSVEPTHIHSYHKTVVPPTCQSKGYTKFWCDCGYEYKSNFRLATSCKFEVSERKEPTCTESGYIKTKCKFCGREKEDEIPKRSHNYDGWHIITKPTCTTTGLKKRICKTCGKEETLVMDATAHNWGNWNEQIHPFCEKDGKSIRTCSVCGKTEERVLPQTHHNYSEWQPSITEPGKWERICQNCGEIEKLNYNPIKKERYRIAFAYLMRVLFIIFFILGIFLCIKDRLILGITVDILVIAFVTFLYFVDTKFTR